MIRTSPMVASFCYSTPLVPIPGVGSDYQWLAPPTGIPTEHASLLQARIRQFARPGSSRAVAYRIRLVDQLHAIVRVEDGGADSAGRPGRIFFQGFVLRAGAGPGFLEVLEQARWIDSRAQSVTQGPEWSGGADPRGVRADADLQAIPFDRGAALDIWRAVAGLHGGADPVRITSRLVYWAVVELVADEHLANTTLVYDHDAPATRLGVVSEDVPPKLIELTLRDLRAARDESARPVSLEMARSLIAQAGSTREEMIDSLLARKTVGPATVARCTAKVAADLAGGTRVADSELPKLLRLADSDGGGVLGKLLLERAGSILRGRSRDVLDQLVATPLGERAAVVRTELFLGGMESDGGVALGPYFAASLGDRGFLRDAAGPACLRAVRRLTDGQGDDTLRSIALLLLATPGSAARHRELWWAVTDALQKGTALQRSFAAVLVLAECVDGHWFGVDRECSGRRSEELSAQATALLARAGGLLPSARTGRGGPVGRVVGWVRSWWREPERGSR